MLYLRINYCPTKSYSVFSSCIHRSFRISGLNGTHSFRLGGVLLLAFTTFGTLGLDFFFLLRGTGSDFLLGSVLTIAGGTDVQSRFTSGIGQKSQATVVLVPMSIESDGGNTFFEGFLGDRFTDLRGRVTVSSESDSVTQRFLVRAGRDERHALGIVDNLGRNMLIAAVNAKSRSRRKAFHFVRGTKRTSFPLQIEFLKLFHWSLLRNR